MKYFNNVYLKDYAKFPYSKLTGRDVLYYTGKIIPYKGTLPSEFDSKRDMAFDCECEFGSWRRLTKVFNK